MWQREWVFSAVHSQKKKFHDLLFGVKTKNSCEDLSQKDSNPPPKLWHKYHIDYNLIVNWRYKIHPHSAFKQQLVRIVHFMGELCVWSSPGSSYPEAPPAPFIFLTFVLQRLYGVSGASAHSEALGAVPPAHDQICFDAASLSFNASMRCARRHTDIILQRDRG